MHQCVENRVIASPEEEMLSIAFFYCPKIEAVTQSCVSPGAVCRDFSFHEYELQVQKDVETTVDEVGLGRFLVI